jgi:hypothetical protein
VSELAGETGWLLKSELPRCNYECTFCTFPPGAHRKCSVLVAESGRVREIKGKSPG